MRITDWLLAIACVLCTASLSAQESIRLTDVVKSSGSGRIDLLKNASIQQLEQLRIVNGGRLVLGVDVNEAASGSEKSSSQAVTLGSLVLTIGYSNSTQRVYDLAAGCCSTETQALVAKAPGTVRALYYTLLGESGSNRITANNAIQGAFDSTIKIDVDHPIYAPGQGIVAVSAVLDIAWLSVNTALGDPEAFYDFSNGFEDLALLNAQDTTFLDDYAAGRDEAVTVILTNPPPAVDPLAIATWNHLPSATSYYIAGYEDKYPLKGDYDFNDLTVAYQVRFGLNYENKVVTIRGTAYLLTRGATYNHDWRLRVALPANLTGTLSCTTFLDPTDEYRFRDCNRTGPEPVKGALDVLVFSRTREIFADTNGQAFTNTLPGQGFIQGPKSVFRVDFDTPVAASSISAAPFDPYLHVLSTGAKIQLLQVNPQFKDSNGFPFGLLMPSNWLPPLEYIGLSTAYPMFDSFVSSEATQYRNWYESVMTSHVIPQAPSSVWAW